MLLSAKALKNVINVNTYEYANEWTVRQEATSGEEQTLFFQLIDLDKNGLRYIPDALTEITVIFPDLDDEQIVEKTTVFPFNDDRSIIQIDLDETDIINSGNVKFIVIENGKTKKFSVSNLVSVEMLNSGGC